MQEWLLDGAPTGCQASCTDNGWIKGDAFLQWLQLIVGQVCPIATRKVLLVLHNHRFQMYIKASDFAMENNVLFLSFTPHMTHKMQPLDVPVYWQENCNFKK
jgi:hypothetical protein